MAAAPSRMEERQGPLDAETLRRRLAEVQRIATELRNVVEANFPESLEPLEAALALAATACISDASQPIALVFVGASSSGKTLALSFLMPNQESDPSGAYFYRSDQFTSRSFVTHRADLKEKECQEVDLLPKIKDKTLITKELGPVFQGKVQDVQERFAVLTSVLDGQGFVSDSGAHGRRGYPEPINFRWLGATTPPENHVLQVISTLGTRMFFYSIDRNRKDIGALVELVRDSTQESKKAAVRESTQASIEKFFALLPPSSVDANHIAFCQKRLRQLVLLTKIAAALRTVKYSDSSSTEIEYPERALFTLKQIAIGSALIHGRDIVEDQDIQLIAHIATSSGPWTRQKVFRALLRQGGEATTSELVQATGLSKPTVCNCMKEIDALALAVYEDHSGENGASAELKLCEAYQELLPLLENPPPNRVVK